MSVQLILVSARLAFTSAASFARSCPAASSSISSSVTALTALSRCRIAAFSAASCQIRRRRQHRNRASSSFGFVAGAFRGGRQQKRVPPPSL